MEGSASGHDWQKVPCVHVNASHFSGTKSNSVDSKFHFFFSITKNNEKTAKFKESSSQPSGRGKVGSF